MGSTGKLKLLKEGRSMMKPHEICLTGKNLRIFSEICPSPVQCEQLERRILLSGTTFLVDSLADMVAAGTV